MISLGIDIGGTGCKCVAFDETGTQKAISYVEYPLAAGVKNLPQDILADSVMKVVSDCVNELPDKKEVKAITASSFGESFAAVDKDGNSLGDIIMYFANSETEEFTELCRKFGKEKMMDIAKILPDASYSLAKMLYTLKHAERPVWKFLFIAAFIVYKFSGKAVCDPSLACRSLVYDVEKRCWSDEILDAFGIDKNLLPEVIPSGGIAGDILPEVAEILGVSKDVKICIGTHDQHVNALAAGAVEIGDAVDVSGTCESINPIYAKIPEGFDYQKNNFASVPYMKTGGYVTYAYNISAGSVLRWFRDAFGGSYKEHDRSCPDHPTDLIILPFFQGMGGTPDVAASATGTIFGLTTETRMPDIYRAVMEGVTYEIRYNVERLAELGVTFNNLCACGGGAKSKIWLQIKADILNMDIVPVSTEETGALGSAILGFAAVTGEDAMEIAKRFARRGEPIKPIPENVTIYNEKYEQYKKLRSIYKGEIL